MHKKAEESAVFTQSWRGCLCACASDVCACFRCVHALQMCARASDVCARFRCVRALQMSARASDVCARASDVCVCFRCVRVHALQMCACASDVCVCFRCVSVRALQMCACASDVCACFRCVSVRALQMCACASDVCACFRCVSVHALQMCERTLQICARKTSHSARLLLQQSRASFMLASFLRAVLILSPDMWDWTRMQALVVMHRRTLCENVDSVKIKVPFYRYRYFMRGIDASYRHTLYRYINPYRWIVTPLVFNSFSKSKSVSRRLL